MRSWLRFDTDKGGVVWGILCCWLGVLLNLAFVRAEVSPFVIVPCDLFVVPGLVTAGLWLSARLNLR